MSWFVDGGGVFAAVLKKDGGAAGVVGEVGCDIEDFAVDDDPAGGAGIVSGYIVAVEHG